VSRRSPRRERLIPRASRATRGGGRSRWRPAGSEQAESPPLQSGRRDSRPGGLRGAVPVRHRGAARCRRTTVRRGWTGPPGARARPGSTAAARPGRQWCASGSSSARWGGRGLWPPSRPQSRSRLTRSDRDRRAGRRGAAGSFDLERRRRVAGAGAGRRHGRGRGFRREYRREGRPDGRGDGGDNRGDRCGDRGNDGRDRRGDLSDDGRDRCGDRRDDRGDRRNHGRDDRRDGCHQCRDHGATGATTAETTGATGATTADTTGARGATRVETTGATGAVTAETTGRRVQPRPTRRAPEARPPPRRPARPVRSRSPGRR